MKRFLSNASLAGLSPIGTPVQPVAAADAVNPGAHLGAFKNFSRDSGQAEFQIKPAPKNGTAWESAPMFSVKAALVTTNRTSRKTAPRPLVPFADAGSTLAPYQVGLPLLQNQMDNPPAR
jgi:hypothetical protein